MGQLRERMIEEMTLRNFAPDTQKSYLYSVAPVSSKETLYAMRPTSSASVDTRRSHCA